jgi:hypothetical protein
VSQGLNERPLFRAVRECFAEHDILLVQKQPFKNDDLTIQRFERGDLWAAADYKDGELIESWTIEHWCRVFGLKAIDLRIECGDGHVSVKPPITRPRLPDGERPRGQRKTRKNARDFQIRTAPEIPSRGVWLLPATTKSSTVNGSYV